jgi:hypothetical protein
MFQFWKCSQAVRAETRSTSLGPLRPTRRVLCNMQSLLPGNNRLGMFKTVN